MSWEYVYRLRFLDGVGKGRWGFFLVVFFLIEDGVLWFVDGGVVRSLRFRMIIRSIVVG